MLGVKSVQILILTSIVLLVGCSKDDVFGYSVPNSYTGIWVAPEQELGGQTIRRYQYVFTLNNIHEAIYGGGNPDIIVDFNQDFPESDWEIQETIESDRYEIVFTPKNENALTPWGTNVSFRRAFIYGTYNGQEAIILDYSGANGALLFRK